MKVIHTRYSKTGTTLYFSKRENIADKCHRSRLVFPQVYALEDCLNILRSLGHDPVVCSMAEMTYSRSFRVTAHIRSFGKPFWDRVTRAKRWRGRG